MTIWTGLDILKLKLDTGISNRLALENGKNMQIIDGHAHACGMFLNAADTVS